MQNFLQFFASSNIRLSNKSAVRLICKKIYYTQFLKNFKKILSALILFVLDAVLSQDSAKTNSLSFLSSFLSTLPIKPRSSKSLTFFATLYRCIYFCTNAFDFLVFSSMCFHVFNSRWLRYFWMSTKNSLVARRVFGTYCVFLIKQSTTPESFFTVHQGQRFSLPTHERVRAINFY